MGSKRGSSLPRRSWSGIAGAALLVASGAIHLDLYLTGYRTIPTIGWLFLLQVIAAFALAVAIPVTRQLAGRPRPGAGFAPGHPRRLPAVAALGLFGFTEVRTTAGIVAGIIDVAAFARCCRGPAVTLRPEPGPPGPARDRGRIGHRARPARRRRGHAQDAARRERRRRSLKARDIGGRWCSPTPRASRCTGSPRTAPNKSVCYGAAPPTGRRSPEPAGWPGVTGKIGTIKRTDGTTQATYDGHPLYTYIGDNAPGQDGGNNLNLNGGLWHVVPVSAG